MFVGAAHQPKFEGLWINMVMANMVLMCVIIEYNGSAFNGMAAFLPDETLQPMPAFLFRVFGVFLLFIFVSLMDGNPRWALKVQLRQDADLGVRLGSMTLPALFLLSHHHFFWAAFSTSLLGAMSLLYNRAPLNRFHWLFIIPLTAAALTTIEVEGLAFMFERAVHPIQLPSVAVALGYLFFMRFGMRRLQKSFTWAEAHVVAQLIGMGLGEVVRATLIKPIDLFSALVLSLTVGMLLIGTCCWGFLSSDMRPLGLSRPMCFYLFFAAFVGFVIQPWIYAVTQVINPWGSVIRFVLSDATHYYLFAYWASILFAILAVMNVQRWAGYFPLIIVRKFYHVIAIAMFLPGLVLARNFLSLSYAVALSALLLAEWLRHGNIEPFGAFLRGYIQAFVDQRDCGTLVTTHIYLLLGCAIPLWLDTGRISLGPFSGLIVLGVGDTLAALVGTQFGKHKWPGSRKSLEGTFAGILGITVASLAMESVLGNVTELSLLLNIISAVMIMILEAVTKQIDNLFLPLWYLIILHSSKHFLDLVHTALFEVY